MLEIVAAILQVVILAGIIWNYYSLKNYQNEVEANVGTLFHIMKDLNDKLKKAKQVEQGDVTAINIKVDSMHEELGLTRQELDYVEKDIVVMADMLAQIKFSSFRQNDHFREDSERVLKIAKEGKKNKHDLQKKTD